MPSYRLRSRRFSPKSPGSSTDQQHQELGCVMQHEAQPHSARREGAAVSSPRHAAGRHLPALGPEVAESLLHGESPSRAPKWGRPSKMFPPCPAPRRCRERWEENVRCQATKVSALTSGGTRSIYGRLRSTKVSEKKESGFSRLRQCGARVCPRHPQPMGDGKLPPVLTARSRAEEPIRNAADGTAAMERGWVRSSQLPHVCDLAS